MDDPVITKYGHFFERNAIETWLDSHKNCPLTRKALSKNDLSPAIVLKEAI
jgi:hypothetical protein